jgi:enediyne biosynthesis protein E4
MRYFLFAAFIFFIACSNDPASKATLFTDVTSVGGIDFSNNLTFTEELNPYTFRNFYNGAGVAIGDINNDGLLDIYFAGNQVSNRLYLNAGNLKFNDITEKAGVACAGVWSSGVTFVDLNADGLLDIYVCKSGNPDVPHRNNELFINNGDLTFTEKSNEYGLDITGLSVQASFFDYDKDGDLDCYLLTNSIRSVGNYDLVKDQREIPDAQGGGNKFFVNENGKFKDFSHQVGIYRSNIGFGLGITLGDFNNDTWPDIFVSNDFFERDYLYINNQKGAFTESLTRYFQSISKGSMGADLADMDNDGVPELFVTEMLPDSLNRKKSKTIYENWDQYQLDIQNGYYHQFPRNVFQKKISHENYAEIGRLAGIAASEWSWGALLFDMDNDGMRDIFIANGIYKDLLDRDYLTYTGAEDSIRKLLYEKQDAITRLIELMPSSKFPNYAFRNNGDFEFRNLAAEWGLSKPMFSSGSAYGDLDNDGDLDLVVNNINAPSVLYRNNTDTAKFRSISISLSEPGQNRMAIGSEIKVYVGSKIYFADNFVTRGFQSSVQPRIHFGLGDGINSVDSIVVQWPDQGYTLLRNISTNQTIRIVKGETQTYIADHLTIVPTGKTFEMELVTNKLFRHKGNAVVDFNRERLLPMMYSNEMPMLIKGDVDNDGIQDVYIGGGKNQSGVFIQFKKEKFEAHALKAMNTYSLSEETKGILFDADHDGDLDLYMATGGRSFPTTSSAQIDRLFLNNGKGEFEESTHLLPFTDFFSTSGAIPIDFDKDGDMDLLVGERFNPFVYSKDGRAFLMENDGTGVFTDVTNKKAGSLLNIGMVTTAIAVDFDLDGWEDLVLAGDWMPIVALKNKNGIFVPVSGDLGFAETQGWWHDIKSADLNNDGKADFVVANHGRNTFFKPGDRMYVNDFDGNGSIEQIFCTPRGNNYYPIVDKDEFLSQLPSLKKDLLYYKDYAKKSIDELFQKTVLSKSKVEEVKVLSSVLFLSSTKGYQRFDLPLEAQYAPIYSLLIDDFDKDGVKDLIAGGNQYQVKPQFGRYDASNCWFFKGVLSKGQFNFEHGIDLNVKGQIRGIETIEVKGIKYILFAKYDDDLEIYKILN